MKPIKQLTEKDYDNIFELSQFAFQYTLSREELEQKKEEAQRHVIWGWMDGEQIAAKVHLIPLSCYINGKRFNMGGISSVATWPEYRRKGMVKDLLHHALIHMKKKGQTISFLHPFSVPFYRKYGWEVVFTNKTYELPIHHFKKKWNGKGNVARVGEEISLLQELYTVYAKRFTGMLMRDTKWWEQRVFRDRWEVAVARNANHQAEGYLIYQAKENKMTIKEFVHLTNNGRKLLLEFIANHDSMAEEVHLTVPENDALSLLLDEPRFKQMIKPYFMVRIVDVLQFLKQYPYRQSAAVTTITLHVYDAFFPENNGMYQLRQTEEGMFVNHVKTVTKADRQHGIHCSVQWLATMFFGYKRPKELWSLGLLDGKLSTIEMLENIIPNQQPFFTDFF